VPLLTVGHGADRRDRLGARLADAEVELVVDVRRFPASRTNPDVARDALAGWLPDRGIGYRWEERLGGRRRRARGEPVVDDWWTVAQFAAYAAYTRTPQFDAAFAELVEASARCRVAAMCSEYVWWRCHRRLIADVAVVGRGVPVTHVLPDGRCTPHRPSPAARRSSSGAVFWTTEPSP
jgi:uncharacterized protein (DUF488 family)